MMNTLSVFPRKTAHPPLVGRTARTCTSITVLFIAGETYPVHGGKTRELGRPGNGIAWEISPAIAAGQPLVLSDPTPSGDRTKMRQFAPNAPVDNSCSFFHTPLECCAT